MGNWITPGQPYEVEIEGKQIKLKALTVSERKELAASVSSLQNSEESIESLYQLVGSQIVSISDMDEDVVEIIKYQSVKTILKIYEAILTGGSLSDTERKNLPSLSDTTSSSPARDVQTAEQADVST